MSVLGKGKVLKAAAWILGLAPLGWVGWLALTDGLGANPIEFLLHRAGDSALVLLLIGLAITPVRRLTRWNQIIKVRRTIGLFAFFYAFLHLMVYLVLDQGLAWEFIWEDVSDRLYITVGFTAFLLLVPLALTSTRGWVRRLGKRWQRLHRLVYVATGLGVIHFFWQVKADTYWPLVAAGVLAALLILRLPRVRELRIRP